MLKRNQDARRGKGGPRTRLGKKVVAGIATFSLVASMCPGVMALAYANEQYAAGTSELLEHHAARWLNRARLGEVRWLPADIQVVDAIKAENVI